MTAPPARSLGDRGDVAQPETTPFDGPHGSFWVVCEECGGRGYFPERDCGDDEWCDESEPNECDRCHGNGGYWDCIDDLCASLIDDWNW